MYYNGTVNFLCNTGYNKKARNSIQLQFVQTGIYDFDSLEVVVQPMNNYPKYIENLQENILENVTMGVNHIEGDITVEKNKLLMLSIPYSQGWKIRVDGKRVESQEVNTMFLGTYLTKGTHRITLDYETPGLKLGAIITFISIGGLCISLLVRKRFHYQLASCQNKEKL